MQFNVLVMNLLCNYYRRAGNPRPLSIADFRLLRTHVVLVRASVARGIMGTYYVPPLGRTGLSVCPYFAFLQASLRYFFGLVFLITRRYQNKYDNSPAKLDSLQVLVEGHRFFRFRFASQLAGTRRFFRFSLSLVETHHFLIICRKILFLNKKSTEFLQWTMLIIILYL